MTPEYENMSQSEANPNEVSILAKRLDGLGIDSSETEKVVAEAVLLFGEGRPEHEVEQIISDYFAKLESAENEADRLAEENA